MSKLRLFIMATFLAITLPISLSVVSYATPVSNQLAKVDDNNGGVEVKKEEARPADGDNAAGGNDAASKILQGSKDVGGKDNKTSLPDFIKTIVNVLLFLLGAIAVVMIVIGGIKYTTSNGDSSAVKSAKDTILYSVIGLVVAILAYAIVNFVVTNLVK